MHRLAAICSMVACLAMLPSRAVASTPTAAPEGASWTLPPPKAGHQRPLVAVLADNDGTETTDFMLPLAVLRESGVADVVSVALHDGEITLMPALKVRADVSIAVFDAVWPEGADIIILPAMHRHDQPQLLRWVRTQADQGALTVSICEGAWIAAAAGVLKGKRATTHWYAFKSIARRFPTTIWIKDRRYVIADGTVTTSGVSASMPVSLALVEAIAGRSIAQDTAKRIGQTSWSAEHDSSRFRLNARRVLTVAANTLAFWRHESVELAVEDRCNEIALAMTADAWSRTYRSRVRTTSARPVVQCRHGLQVLTAASASAHSAFRSPPATMPVSALDTVLSDISARYGESTADIVALGMEYSREARTNQKN